MKYIIKRGMTTVATVKPEAKQSKKTMDVNTVKTSLTLSAAVDCRIGDYVDVYDERYVLLDESTTIRTPPNSTFTNCFSKATPTSCEKWLLCSLMAITS
ncbi:hypothetical protein LLH06_20385 [Mucilaginibacter daejeonensis]|uniref:hypothetical protein n=1 Tax=Mucilaginibacter daejeonensis TaxID=398049 RepID=UPI001D176CAE|nr:hypothetical protein [Mucilaginibacter daejeonensis]UEG53298.1 hypothetical protein LLH06_20385 [Mucilaginibacter daejeonensis]